MIERLNTHAVLCFSELHPGIVFVLCFSQKFAASERLSKHIYRLWRVLLCRCAWQSKLYMFAYDCSSVRVSPAFVRVSGTFLLFKFIWRSWFCVSYANSSPKWYCRSLFIRKPIAKTCFIVLKYPHGADRLRSNYSVIFWIQKFSAFYEGSLPCSQNPNAEPYRVLVESNSRPTPPFIISFIIIIASTSRSLKFCILCLVKYFMHAPHAFNKSHISHSTWYDHINNTIQGLM